MTNLNDQLGDALKFRDEGIPEAEFEILLRAALARGREFDFSQWLRDKPLDFYLGMVSAVNIYATIHNRFGFVLRGSEGIHFDDQLGQELALVITSLSK